MNDSDISLTTGAIFATEGRQRRSIAGWIRGAIGPVLLRIYRLALMKFINVIGALSQPGQWPSGILQGWALRRMGVECPSNEVWIGPGTALDNPARLRFGRRVVIGANTRMTGYKVTITIGDDFLSAPGLCINVGSHDLRTLVPIYAAVVIGNGVWCGTRVIICSGVHVGDNAVIGAGAVVVKDVPASHVAAGVPCKPLRPIECADRSSPECWSNFRRHTARIAAGLAVCAWIGLGAGRGDAAQSPVAGVMTHFAHGWDVDLIPRIRMAGITTVRDEIYWNEIEPEKGRFVFPERVERTMAALGDAGISPLIALTFANEHYDSGQTPHTREGIEGYARYSAEVVRHFRGQIQAVEVWNEYNGTFCKGPATNDRAATYGKMLRAAYAAIKAERPGVTVAGGSTAGIPLPYFEKLFAHGALDAMDVVSIHPYRTDRAPEGLEDEIEALRGLVARYNGGRPKPIWVTEIGWPTIEASAPGGRERDENVQAQYLVRAFALMFSAGVERVYWYAFRDYRVFKTMGLARDDDRATPKAAYFALATLIEALRDKSFVTRDPTRSDFYSLRFQSPAGRSVRVMWSLEPASVELAAGAVATSLLGERLAPSARIEITDSPVFIEGGVSGMPGTDPGIILTKSQADFAAEQGSKGWSYGFATGTDGDFDPLTDFRLTDWKTEWIGPLRSLSISARDQHPAAAGAAPVAVVRRWRSDRDAAIRVTGEFHCGPAGDGVRASIRVNGERVWDQSLGGHGPGSARCDFVQTVRAGGVIDFAVDPGEAADPNYDATQTAVTIRDVSASPKQ